MSNFEFGGLPNIDFSNINLGDIDFSGIDMAGVDMAEATTPATATPTPVYTPDPIQTNTTPIGGGVDSAYDIIISTLKYYGLLKEGDTALLTTIKDAWNKKIIGPNSTVDDIGIQLRDDPVFQARFPANKTLAAQGKPQYSVSSYLRLESDFKNKLQEAGMPPGFYDDPSDFQKFIEQDVSPDEVYARAQLGYQAVKQADPQVVAEFQRLYGVSEGELAAYFIDPQRMRPTFDRYEAERQARAAQIAAAGTTQAQMTVGRETAEQLARAGISGEEAQAGFAALGDTQELFRGMTAGEEAISQEEQIAGTFNTSASARQAIAKRRRSRQAAFEGGGSFGTTQQGQTGLTTVS